MQLKLGGEYRCDNCADKYSDHFTLKLGNCETEITLCRYCLFHFGEDSTEVIKYNGWEEEDFE